MLAGALIVAAVVFSMLAGDVADLIGNAGWWALLALLFPLFVAVGAWRWSD